MRLAKALILLALSIGLLAAAATASAVRPPVEDGTLSVRDGRATVTLRMKGSVIGRLARGRLTVTDSPDGATIIVRGAEDEVPVSGRTTLYSGKNIRFRIADDRRFAVKVAGKGLNFSAVGRGDGWLDGWGDPEGGVFFDGSYSLNGTDYPTLPNERTRFELSAPAN
ncbi:MAG TPA: hypothetical protein VE440_04460 [Gaiellaceae bacterium]|nr:hypothetical protein [Gaiellaceae bacterium]